MIPMMIAQAGALLSAFPVLMNRTTAIKISRIIEMKSAAQTIILGQY